MHWTVCDCPAPIYSGFMLATFGTALAIGSGRIGATALV
jgi:hypothetical protein